MTDTLSTQSSATTDKLVPTDTDKDPIKWDNNRATIEGKLHEVALYYTRTDQTFTFNFDLDRPRSAPWLGIVCVVQSHSSRTTTALQHTTVFKKR